MLENYLIERRQEQSTSRQKGRELNLIYKWKTCSRDTWKETNTKYSWAIENKIFHFYSVPFPDQVSKNPCQAIAPLSQHSSPTSNSFTTKADSLAMCRNVFSEFHFTACLRYLA